MADESTPEESTLADHLTHLAATADDVADRLSRSRDGGEIDPQALRKAEHLSTSLKDVIHALTHHEHLAMTSDDVWKMLTVKHKEHEGDEFT